MNRRKLIAAAAAVVIAGGGGLTWALVAGGDGATHSGARGPHAVTEAEAERLAITRFQSYRHGGVEFRTTISTSGQAIRLDGSVDYRRHVGYALASGAGAAYALQWNPDVLLAWPLTAGTTTRPAALPAGQPSRRALDPRATATDAVLAFVLQLGQDRPDNAQLIEQGGARWLRSDKTAGRRVDVIRGPRAASTSGGAIVDYWITAGSTLLRADVHLGGGQAITRIDLNPRAYRSFPVSSALPR